MRLHVCWRLVLTKNTIGFYRQGLDVRVDKRSGAGVRRLETRAQDA